MGFVAIYYICHIQKYGDIKDNVRPTLSPLLSNDVLTLPVKELQVICHHPLLAFMDDFGVGAGVQVLSTSHSFFLQPC